LLTNHVFFIKSALHMFSLMLLQNDKRYLTLEPVADERKRILLSYIDDLDKKGAPPPPTASEPSRRNIKWGPCTATRAWG